MAVEDVDAKLETAIENEIRSQATQRNTVSGLLDAGDNLEVYQKATARIRETASKVAVRLLEEGIDPDFILFNNGQLPGSVNTGGSIDAHAEPTTTDVNKFWGPIFSSAYREISYGTMGSEEVTCTFSGLVLQDTTELKIIKTVKHSASSSDFPRTDEVTGRAFLEALQSGTSYTLADPMSTLLTSQKLLPDKMATPAIAVTGLSEFWCGRIISFAAQKIVAAESGNSY